MNFSEKMQGAGVFVDNTRTTNNYLYLNNKIFRAQNVTIGTILAYWKKCAASNPI